MADGRLHRQPLPMLAAVGLLLPAIIALAVWFYSDQEQRREAVERDAIYTARHIVELSDRELDANMRTLALLADAPGLARGAVGPWQEFAVHSAKQMPGWRAVVLRRIGTERPLVETSSQTDRRSLLPLPASIAPEGVVEGVLREGRYCPCVVLHRPALRDPKLVVTVYLDPGIFQDILLKKTTKSRIGAVLDRQARFAARAEDYEDRVGMVSSRSAQQAVARGGDGFYRGVSLEGVPIYAAYTTSPLSGWSAHEAVDRSALDSARTWSNAATATGILAALALAAGLALYGIYEMRLRRRDESRFLEMQKSEAISQFTGTVVHDFRNILAVVEAGLTLLSRHRTKAEADRTIREVRDTLGRGERLTNQLLSFVRGDAAEIRTIDLRQLLVGSEELLRRSLGDDIHLTWTVADDARYVRANADQLELALLNLAVNARDALEGQGRLTIATEKSGNRVVISVSDNGPGIPPHRREDVFQLYYTTKAVGKGTGLGLAQVAGAMHHANGEVKLTDAPGGGARFLLILNAGDPAAEDVPGTRH